MSDLHIPEVILVVLIGASSSGAVRVRPTGLTCGPHLKR